MSFLVKVPFLKFQSRLSRYLCRTSFKSGRYAVCVWMAVYSSASPWCHHYTYVPREWDSLWSRTIPLLSQLTAHYPGHHPTHLLLLLLKSSSTPPFLLLPTCASAPPPPPKQPLKPFALPLSCLLSQPLLISAHFTYFYSPNSSLLLLSHCSFFETKISFTEYCSTKQNL